MAEMTASRPMGITGKGTAEIKFGGLKGQKILPRQYPINEERNGSNTGPKAHAPFTSWEISTSLARVVE